MEQDRVGGDAFLMFYSSTGAVCKFCVDHQSELYQKEVNEFMIRQLSGPL